MCEDSEEFTSYSWSIGEQGVGRVELIAEGWNHAHFGDTDSGMGVWVIEKPAREEMHHLTLYTLKPECIFS